MYTRHPKFGNGLLPLIRIEESTRSIWVNTKLLPIMPAIPSTPPLNSRWSTGKCTYTHTYIGDSYYMIIACSLSHAHTYTYTHTLVLGQYIDVNIVLMYN